MEHPVLSIGLLLINLVSVMSLLFAASTQRLKASKLGKALILSKQREDILWRIILCIALRDRAMGYKLPPLYKLKVLMDQDAYIALGGKMPDLAQMDPKTYGRGGK